jgi:hypothetical protein
MVSVIEAAVLKESVSVLVLPVFITKIPRKIKSPHAWGLVARV